MEPEGLSPYLQQPATCPYPEPDRSSLYPYATSWRTILFFSVKKKQISGICFYFHKQMKHRNN
jgi:hypothetical protein